MTAHAEDLKFALRTLLLPIDPLRESEALDAAANVLWQNEIQTADHAESIHLGLAEWRETGSIPQLTKMVAHAAIVSGNDNRGQQISVAWAKVHPRLVGTGQMAFDESLAFLSNLRLIAHLAVFERMSSARIASVLEKREVRTTFCGARSRKH